MPRSAGILGSVFPSRMAAAMSLAKPCLPSMDLVIQMPAHVARVLDDDLPFIEVPTLQGAHEPIDVASTRRRFHCGQPTFDRR